MTIPRAEQTATTCYRHPGRPTAVRCSRCERPICADCMNDAPVGFQCPDCVRQGAPARQRTLSGASASPTDGRLTYLLIAVNVVMFLLQQTQQGFTQNLWQYNAAIATQHEYYRLLTSTFLHTGVLHILFNMVALFVVGPPLERVFGWWRFLALYLVAGIAGSTLAYVVSSPFSATEGASGAIFGLFAAMWVVARGLRADTAQITGLIVINLVLTFTLPNISWQGHLGGLAAGALIALAYIHAPRQWRIPGQLAMLVVVLAVCAVAALARTAALT